MPIEAHGIVTVTIQPQLTLTATASASSLPTQRANHHRPLRHRQSTFTITAFRTMPTGPVTITATASTGASRTTPTQITLNVTDQSAAP